MELKDKFIDIALFACVLVLFIMVMYLYFAEYSPKVMQGLAVMSILTFTVSAAELVIKFT